MPVMRANGVSVSDIAVRAGGSPGSLLFCSPSSSPSISEASGRAATRARMPAIQMSARKPNTGKRLVDPAQADRADAGVSSRPLIGEPGALRELGAVCIASRRIAHDGVGNAAGRRVSPADALRADEAEAGSRRTTQKEASRAGRALDQLRTQQQKPQRQPATARRVEQAQIQLWGQRRERQERRESP